MANWHDFERARKEKKPKKEKKKKEKKVFSGFKPPKHKQEKRN